LPYERREVPQHIAGNEGHRLKNILDSCAPPLRVPIALCSHKYLIQSDVYAFNIDSSAEYREFRISGQCGALAGGYYAGLTIRQPDGIVSWNRSDLPAGMAR
jgi:hypothetical protein